jgi:hypothetical protein
LLKEILF